jgi:hypothetical protein
MYAVHCFQINVIANESTVNTIEDLIYVFMR